MQYDMNLALMIWLVIIALSLRTGFRFFSKNEKAKEVGGTITGNLLRRWLK